MSLALWVQPGIRCSEYSVTASVIFVSRLLGILIWSSCLECLWFPKGMQWQLWHLGLTNKLSHFLLHTHTHTHTHTHSLTHSLLFCGLSRPVSHSLLLLPYFWIIIWGKTIMCAHLKRSHGAGPFSGHLFRGRQVLLRHQLLACSGLL